MGSSFIWDRERQTFRPRAEVLAERAAEAAERRSPVPCPAYRDGMPEIKSMVDGKLYTSKREYERSVERNGCAVVGFDKHWTDHIRNPVDEKAEIADLVNDIKKSIEQETSK